MPWPDEFVDRTVPSADSPRVGHRDDHDALWSAIENIEAVLGLVPQGTDATVSARLDALTTQITEGLDSADTAIGQAITDHVDNADPHSGRYGQIITPDEPDGGGVIQIGGDFEEAGDDYEVWLDTEEA